MTPELREAIRTFLDAAEALIPKARAALDAAPTENEVPIITPVEPEPTPAPAPEPTPPLPPVLGLNSYSVHWRESFLQEHLLTLGIKEVRVTGVLQHFESGSHRAYMIESAAEAERLGLRILWVLHNNDGYFKAPINGDWNKRMIRFAEFAATLPALAGVQLYNEMDWWHEAPFGAAQELPMVERGRLYGKFLHAACPRIKAVNPNALVVTGGTAEPPDSGFIAGMLESGPPCDVVAFHAYGPWEWTREKFLEARRIVGDKPLWVTECGSRWHTLDEQEQLDDWRSVIEGNEAERIADRLYPYALEAGAETGHSLLGSGLTPRAAYGWLRDR